jgi:hypothetical protein
MLYNIDNNEFVADDENYRKKKRFNPRGVGGLMGLVTKGNIG